MLPILKDNLLEDLDVHRVVVFLLIPLIVILELKIQIIKYVTGNHMSSLVQWEKEPIYL